MRSLPSRVTTHLDAAGSSVKVCLRGVFLLMLCSPMAAYSAPPDLQTPAPVIYLADNLDEQDNLGFCIDTVGRGFSERLHAHSCKPRGGDVQFDYDRRRIVSATYAGKCATLQAPAAAGVSLGIAGLFRGVRRPDLRLRCRCDGVPARGRPEPLSGGGRRKQDGRAFHVTKPRARAVRFNRCHAQTVARQRGPVVKRAANSPASLGGIARERRGLTRSPEANIRRK